MAAALRVLFVGSSQLRFQESDAAGSLSELTHRRLAEVHPSASWESFTAVIYPLADMETRVRSLVDLRKPDAVLLYLGSSTFAEAKVEYALRQKYRRLARLAVPFVGAVRSAAGGGTEGSSGARGLIFRFPRKVGRQVFGAAPLVTPEAALQAVDSTIRMLEKRCGGRLLVVLSSGTPQVRESAERTARLIEGFNDAVSAICEALGVRYVHPARCLAGRGADYVLHRDGVHADLQTRRHLSEALAGELLVVLGVPSGDRPH